MKSTTLLARQQFGASAVDYLTSDVHARGVSLQRLVELVEPQRGWRVLDVATGAGHTACAFAARGARVVASDVTFEMLTTARENLPSGAVAFCQHEAAALPYPAGSFDCVTCRIAAHHFASPADFVREAARVLKAGGVLALADNIGSGEPKVAQFVNTFEELRDPSHVWAYSPDDWETFFFAAGLELIHREQVEKTLDFDEWAACMRVEGAALDRLQALLVQAPTAAREWLRPQQVGRRLVFRLVEGILIGRKA